MVVMATTIREGRGLVAGNAMSAETIGLGECYMDRPCDCGRGAASASDGAADGPNLPAVPKQVNHDSPGERSVLPP